VGDQVPEHVKDESKGIAGLQGRSSNLIHRQAELRKPDAGLNWSSTPQPAKSVRRD
jgi:hypothetical protein